MKSESIGKEVKASGLSTRDIQSVLKKRTGLNIGTAIIHRAIRGAPSEVFQKLRSDILDILSEVQQEKSA